MTRIALAVDFGGTKVEAALVTDTGALVEGSRARHPSGGHSDSATLQDAVRTVVAQAMAALPA